ncbi:MAG: YggS family pyridoxal phosphate-dependent enzyme [Deltaproteobacteria bacterium]|nr:YggS family pyridoxal phosphate-dependent enzyme [Deltaproteobacteria bacterium]
MPEPEASALRDRFDAVRSRLENAAKASGRNMADIRLVAISKTHPAPMLAELFSYWRQGTPTFGENYVQEALEKQKDVASLLVKSLNGASLPEWHFTGHVQSRKAKDVTGRFALIHTLDSEKLAAQIRKAVLAENLPPQAVLLQINIGGENQKSGLPAEEAERFIDAVRGMEQVRVEGLMCLPPFSEDAEASRPYFAAMRELREALRTRTGLPLPHLSMGMSHDCEIAVSQGATMVRVGTDIFGPRQYA